MQVPVCIETRSLLQNTIRVRFIQEIDKIKHTEGNSNQNPCKGK
jgi:hypothetical protein